MFQESAAPAAFVTLDAVISVRDAAASRQRDTKCLRLDSVGARRIDKSNKPFR